MQITQKLAIKNKASNFASMLRFKRRVFQNTVRNKKVNSVKFKIIQFCLPHNYIGVIVRNNFFFLDRSKVKKAAKFFEVRHIFRFVSKPHF